jgi:hypothetical protein
VFSGLASMAGLSQVQLAVVLLPGCWAWLDCKPLGVFPSMYWSTLRAAPCFLLVL